MRMKLIVMAIAAASLPSPAWASGCYVLTGDAKNLCLARERDERSMCYAIQEQATRSLCLAEVGQGR